MKAVSAVSLPRNWGGMPRMSAVFMDSLYGLIRRSTGAFWSRSEVSVSFLVTVSRPFSRLERPARSAQSPGCASAYPKSRSCAVRGTSVLMARLFTDRMRSPGFTAAPARTTVVIGARTALAAVRLT
jgi:hypothetical protein